MRQARQILAVALVATALCADRTVAAAPTTVRTASASVAARLVSSLTVRFQRVMPGVKLVQPRAARFDAASTAVVRFATETFGYRRTFSPIEFSLPPPSLI